MTQTMPSNLWILVPAFNEAGMIWQTLEGLQQQHYNILVVDDASTDETYEVVRKLNVRCVRHPVNLGQGAALMTGMEYLKRIGAEYVVHFDADGQHQLSDIPALLEPLLMGEADICLGSRFLLPATTSNISTGRKWLLKSSYRGKWPAQWTVVK